MAWGALVTNGGELDPALVMDVWAESNQGDSRAVAALELLEAVGYEP